MKRVAANVILIFAALLFASSSSLWLVRVTVSPDSVLGLMSSMAQSDPRAPASPAPLVWGKDVYTLACAQCHGLLNRELGVGFQANRPLAESTPRDIYQLITWGGPKALPEDVPYTGKPFEPSRAHPAFPATLTETERWAVSEYVYNGALEPGENLSPARWIETWKSRMNTLTTEDPAGIYGSYCANCHGIDGYGNGEYASDLVPNPRDLRDTAWLASQSFDWLFLTIKSGRIEGSSENYGNLESDGHFSGMPSFGEYLDDNQIEAVVSYIESWGYSLDLRESRWSGADSGPLAPDSSGWRWGDWTQIRSILDNAPENPPAWVVDREHNQ